jgi:hypothetical protein
MPESGDHVLAAYESEQEIPVVVAEEVEALVGAGAVVFGSADLVEDLRANGGILQCADEFELAAIGSGDELSQVAEAVAGFAAVSIQHSAFSFRALLSASTHVTGIG